MLRARATGCRDRCLHHAQGRRGTSRALQEHQHALALPVPHVRAGSHTTAGQCPRGARGVHVLRRAYRRSSGGRRRYARGRPGAPRPLPRGGPAVGVQVQPVRAGKQPSVRERLSWVRLPLLRQRAHQAGAAAGRGPGRSSHAGGRTGAPGTIPRHELTVAMQVQHVQQGGNAPVSGRARRPRRVQMVRVASQLRRTTDGPRSGGGPDDRTRPGAPGTIPWSQLPMALPVPAMRQGGHAAVQQYPAGLGRVPYLPTGRIQRQATRAGS
jgi:hypothetical protein